ncbi:MAG: alpha/beta fold hydrolase [Planctomycetes bacterium]|nr:alpha/beta fold hydrolase [Planctomycetota bacterium]
MEVARSGERVCVLLHGAVRTRWSLWRLERALGRAGYRTVNETYPSLRRGIPELASSLAALLVDRLAGAEPAELSFVTHSMGALVARHYLSRQRPPAPGRVVMLAPPSTGSSLARALAANPVARLLVPRTLEALSPDGDARSCGAPDRPFGIIAGSRGDPRGYNPLIAGDDDGIVGVEEARLDGAADFLLLPHVHTFIMNFEDTIGQVLHFLEHGRFRR